MIPIIAEAMCTTCQNIVAELFTQVCTLLDLNM